jgi:hypothetical protein
MSSNPDTSGSNTENSNVTKLLEYVSQELGTYRSRQTRNLREVVIVQALISWGVIQLKLYPGRLALAIHVAAAVACLAATYVGTRLLESDKNRIYFLREVRETLAGQLRPAQLRPAPGSSLFYPVGPVEDDAKQGQVENKYPTEPTSRIYKYTLWIVGLFSTIVNLLIGFGHPSYHS